MGSRDGETNTARARHGIESPFAHSLDVPGPRRYPHTVAKPMGVGILSEEIDHGRERTG